MIMNIQQNTVSENNFEQCIKCTICTVYCPVAAVNPDYPGPKQAGPDGERLRLKQPDFFDSALKYCLNCKRCEVACPSNVRIGDIIQAARIKYGPKHNTSVRNYILANTDLVGTLATPLAPVVNAAVATKPVRMIMDKVMGIDHRRIFPKYSHGTFESWYRRHAAEQQASFERQVSYFHGCYVNYNNPQLGKDMIRIMNALGYGVRLLEKEKCCGVALISNGLYSQAKRQARTNMESIRTAVKGDGRDVITTSSTCTFTIRDVVQNPLDLRSAEVGVDNETRLAAYHLRYALALEFVAIVRRTAILPYDGIVYRLLGIRIPHDRRLALVRDADTGNVESVYVQRGDGLGYNRRLRRPYLVRVVLDPARARKYLSELLLRHGTRSARLVEYDGTRTARALIQSKNILFHLRLVVYLCFY